MDLAERAKAMGDKARERERVLNRDGFPGFDAVVAEYSRVFGAVKVRYVENFETGAKIDKR